MNEGYWSEMPRIKYIRTLKGIALPGRPKKLIPQRRSRRRRTDTEKLQRGSASCRMGSKFLLSLHLIHLSEDVGCTNV